MTNCKRCGSPVPASKRECQSCGEDNGYPNVRLAEQKQEQEALLARYHDAQVSATARNCQEALSRFGVAVLGSSVVIARALTVIFDLMESDQRTYTNYHKQLASGARIAEDNEFDGVRTQYEAALFPNFHHDILCGCLSINGLSIASYGEYALVLREKMIAHRASVFEENPHVFCTRHGLLLNAKIPPGYRAGWSERHILAQAKLHSLISPGTQDVDFPSILVSDREGAKSDFIEAHIYGPINRQSIEKVIGRRPKTGADRVLWKRLQHLVKSTGATLEEI